MNIQEKKILPIMQPSYQTYLQRELTIKLKTLIEKYHYSHCVFLCIGSDKILGDCLGPLIGEKLKKLTSISYMQVYGNLSIPLCYAMVSNCMEKIKRSYLNPCIIAIDAALSEKEQIGKVAVGFDSLQLGKSLKKEKSIQPDLSIKVIVGKNYDKVEENLQSLQNLSLGDIICIAEQVADCILKIFL